MKHVFVNGVQVLVHGEHTGAKPGRFIRGHGYRNVDSIDFGLSESFFEFFDVL